MNISKKFPLPEFVLLDGDNQNGDQLAEREVMLHIPSKTILEVLAIEPEELKKYEGTSHFPFVFTNIDGEDEHHLLLTHETGNETQLSDIFVNAAQWYGNYANWMDAEINAL